MRITINSLTLNNFKGTPFRHIEIGGQNADITGANGTGKTTIADAWSWLLFDMDTAGRKGVEACKTTTGTGFAHYLTHSVAAEIEVDGRVVTLKKAVEENWTKPRGKSEQVFSGNVSSYWIDEVPTQKGAYDMYMDKLVPFGLFKILSDPMYFSTVLHYKERLSVLIELVGGITDEEISEGDEDLQHMLIAKGDKTLDDFKKMLLESRRRANEQAAGIPARIDENKRVLVGPAEDYGKLNDEIARLTASLEAIDASESSAKAKRAEMDRDNIAVWQIKKEREAKVAGLVRGLNSARDAAQDDLLRLEREINRLKSANSERSHDLQLLRTDAEALKSRLEKLRADWTDANKRLTEAQKRTFSAEVVTVKGRCPTCMQVLPQSMIDEQIAEIRDAFDRETTRLADVAKTEMDSAQRAGVSAKAKLAEMKADIKAIAEASERDSATLSLLMEECATKKTAFEAIPVASPASVVDHPEVVALDDAVRAAEEAMDRKYNSPEDDARAEMIRASKAKIQKELSELKEKAYAKTHREQAEKRIADLRAELRSVTEVIDNADSLLFQIGRYSTVRSEKLEAKINAIFSQVSFKFYSEQINGGISDTCEAIVGETTFAKANTAAQVNAGLDIINMLSTYHETYVPVFCDRVESINRLIPSVGQQIRLIVNDDPVIRINGEKI